MGLAALERTLRATTPLGTRNALLVLGNGVHLQAARQAGLHELDPWLGALRRIAEESGVRDMVNRDRPAPVLWDVLVRQMATRQGLRAPQADRRLRTLLVGELGSTERRRRALPLYGRILDLRFANIISLNIDRTLALHTGRETFVSHGSMIWPDPRFFRHSLIEDADGVATRIWYPHGDSCDASLVRLGTTEHSARLMALEDQRSTMMKYWIEERVATWSYPGAEPHTRLKTPRRLYEQCRDHDDNWYTMMFVAPLVIVGASLPLEDWPVWWLLHQRARNLNVFRTADVPRTFVLTAEGDAPPHLAGRPANIEVVEFPSYDALWEFALR